MHGCTSKQYIFGATTSTFNAMHFDSNPSACQCEKEDRNSWGFQILHFYSLFLSDIMAVKGLNLYTTTLFTRYISSEEIQRLVKKLLSWPSQTSAKWHKFPDKMSSANLVGQDRKTQGDLTGQSECWFAHLKSYGALFSVWSVHQELVSCLCSVCAQVEWPVRTWLEDHN